MFLVSLHSGKVTGWLALTALLLTVNTPPTTDGGSYFPGTGAAHKVGSGEGLGTNVNLGWNGSGVGDGDYMAAFK